MKSKRSIGVVIISYGHERLLPGLAEKIRAQMRAGDKLVVIDNHPNGKGADSVASNAAVDFAIKAENNGFAAAANIGASKVIKDVDIVLLLNPATVPSETLLSAIRSADYSRYAAAMPLITLPAAKVNSAGNVVHISGLSWCDGYEQPAKAYTTDREISVLSGICIAVTKDWWKKIGGMSESYFMYYEDTDISTRIIVRGGKIALLTGASVEHAYDYKKGAYKWLYLERNRPLYILQTWPGSVIAVLFVQLVCIEIGLWFVALLQGRLRSKAKAASMTAAALPAALRARRQLFRNRTISGYDFLQTLTYKLDTPLLGALGRNVAVRGFFATYYRLSLWILKAAAKS